MDFTNILAIYFIKHGDSKTKHFATDTPKPISTLQEIYEDQQYGNSDCNSSLLEQYEHYLFSVFVLLFDKNINGYCCTVVYSMVVLENNLHAAVIFHTQTFFVAFG